jgi:M-phase phosphoprotein 6
MWKPGGPKPLKQKGTNVIDDGTRHRSSESQNVAVSPAADAAAAIGAPQKGEANSGATRRNLSGATLNMRFMQRKAHERQQQHSHQSLSPVVAPGTNNDPMETGEPDSTNDHHPSSQQQQTPLVSRDEWVIEKNHSAPGSFSEGGRASTIDMYGENHVQMVGRRSFGGFNAQVENMRKLSIQACSGGNIDGGSSTKKPDVSDEELLKRYQEFVQQGRKKNKPSTGQNEKKRKLNSNDSADGRRAHSASPKKHRY